MPEHWHARVASIAAYDDDASAQGRFESWRYALGGGARQPCRRWRLRDLPRQQGVATPCGYRSAHSIYFEALAEHGYVGLVIFLALGLGAYVSAGSVVRRCRDHADLAWAADLAAMVQVSIAAYAVAGLFLNLATFDLYYHLIAIVVITQALVRQVVMLTCRPTLPRRLSPFERPSDAARDGVEPLPTPRGLIALA